MRLVFSNLSLWSNDSALCDIKAWLLHEIACLGVVSNCGDSKIKLRKDDWVKKYGFDNGPGKGCIGSNKTKLSTTHLDGFLLCLRRFVFGCQWLLLLLLVFWFLYFFICLQTQFRSQRLSLAETRVRRRQWSWEKRVAKQSRWTQRVLNWQREWNERK